MIPTFDLACSLLGTHNSGVGERRYWRVTSIQIGGTFLQISELQMLENSVNVTSQATVSASHVADSNGVTELVDNNLGSQAAWNEGNVETGTSFWIKFDFGAGNGKNINGVKQGGFDTSNRHMSDFTLQWSDDNSSWTTLGSKTGLSYPGNNTLSSEYTFP